MYIVIQIGGEGSRLKRILKNNPKCFVNILNKKIIDYQIEKLLQIKFNKIIILNNIKFSFVESYLKKKYGDIFIFFNETKPLGTGGSLSFLKNITTKNFLMLYGDIIFNVDLKKLFYFHLRKKSDLTIISHPNSHPYDSDIIDVDKNNKIVNFYKKPHKSNLFLGNLCLSGIFVFNKKILNQIKNFQYQDFSKDVIPLLIKNKFKLYSYRTREYMKDAGKICRIKQIEADIKIKKFYRGNINKKMPAFFLDKDGVLNEEKYNRSYQNIKKVVFGSTKAVKIINDNNYLAVVVTNQPAIAKGFIKENDFIKDIKFLETYFGKKSAYFDKIYYCPCHPMKGFKGEVKKYKRECSCRKPNNGMIINAVKDLNIDIKKSIMVGDRVEDYLAAKRSNLKFYFIGNTKIKGIKTFPNLYLAVKYFFKN